MEAPHFWHLNLADKGPCHVWFTGTDVREIWSCQYGSFDNWMYIDRYYYIYSHKYRAYYIGTSYTRLICFVLLGQGMNIFSLWATRRLLSISGKKGLWYVYTYCQTIQYYLAVWVAKKWIHDLSVWTEYSILLLATTFK